MEYFKYRDFNICLLKKASNKNIYFRMQNDGSIKVTCPFHLHKNDILKYLDQFLDKLVRKYDVNLFEKIAYNHGARLFLLGKKIYLDIKEANVKKPYVNLVQDKLCVYTNSLDSSVLKRCVDVYIRTLANKVLKERFYLLVDNFKEINFIPELKIRNMKSKYGVCYYKKNLVSLSVLLIHFDFECIDYVIYHELAHFIHPNHSKKFYNLVERYVSNYKDTIKKLQNRL